MSEDLSPGDERPTSELLGGILGDTRDLIAAHADRLHRELKGDLKSFKDVVVSTLVAALAVVVCAIMIGLALTATMVTLGVPTWAATWIVVVLAAAVATIFVKKMRATSMEDHVVDGLEQVRDDVAWAGKATVQAFDGDQVVETPPPTQPLH